MAKTLTSGRMLPSQVRQGAPHPTNIEIGVIIAAQGATLHV
jgi:hypothetical protein